VGVSLPLTGIFGNDGALVRDSYLLWQQKVNDSGGINGHPVEIIFYDNKSDPATGAKFIEKLIVSDKVDLLLGGFGSSLVFAESAVAEKYKYPLISGAASSDKLFTRGFKCYFSTLGKATEEVRGCVEMFKAVKPKPKTAVIIGADNLFTWLACEGFKTYCDKEGIDVVLMEQFPMALQDYNSMLLKVKAKNPDILLVGSHLMVALKTIKAMKEIDYSPKAVAFSYGPTVPKFIEDLKADAEYVIAASEWTPTLPYKGPVFATAAEFNQAYFEKFKRHPDYVEAASAGGALAQQMAIEALGMKPPLSEKDREALVGKLHSTTFETFYGTINFGAEGANIAHPPVAVQVQGGHLKNVYPLDVADAQILYPFKPWKERK